MDLLLGTRDPIINTKFSLDSSSDIQFDDLGALITVEDKDKLTQEVAKVLLTDQGSNLFEDRYGTILHSLTGVGVSESTLFAIIKQTVLDALSLFASIQQDVDNTEEKLATVESISVAFNVDNKNEMMIGLIVTTEADQEAHLAITLPTTG